MHQWRCVHVCVRLYLCVCVWSSVSAHGYLFAAKPTETKPTKIKMTWIKKEKSRKCLSLDGTFTKCIMHSLWGPAFLLHCLGNVSRNVHNSAKNSPKMQTKHDLILFFTVCLNPFFVDLVHKCIKLKCEDFMMEVNDCKHNCTLSLFNAHRTKKKKKGKQNGLKSFMLRLCLRRLQPHVCTWSKLEWTPRLCAKQIWLAFWS